MPPPFNNGSFTGSIWARCVIPATKDVIKGMSQAELRSYTVQIRAKLDDGTYTPEDAYRTLWNRDTPLTYEQRQLIHQTLELPFEAPSELDILLHEPATAELI